MTPSNPATTQHLVKGARPQSGETEGVRGTLLKLETNIAFGVGTPTASAWAQDTCLGMPGQRTGRVAFTQERVGAPSMSREFTHRRFGLLVLEPIHGHPTLPRPLVGGQA